MSTLSNAIPSRHESELVPRAHLFVVLECSRPLAGSLRCALEGVSEVVIGRGDERAATRARTQTGATLRLAVPDPRMSSLHARIEPQHRGWVIRDLGSKNGTSVNGERLEERALSDGDVVRLGHTLFIFRAALPCDAAAASDFSASGDSTGLSTMLPAFARELDALARIARSTLPILILGETGSGKELVARSVHALSRRSGDFVPINCGALPVDLVEGQLFGHKRGAFSGAIADSVGLLRSADHGTVLLDEIGELPPSAQVALLRTLQDHEVLPIGGTRPIKVDLRVMAATHRDLEEQVAAGHFREDLFARLAGFGVRLPPLRERREDIGLMVSAILRELAPQPLVLTPEAGAALLEHSWPRNARELEKALRRGAALAAGDAIDSQHLQLTPRPPDRPSCAPRAGDVGPSTSASTDRRATLVAALVRRAGNVAAVAADLRTSRTQVHRWAKRYAIDLNRFRRS